MPRMVPWTAVLAVALLGTPVGCAAPDGTGASVAARPDDTAGTAEGSGSDLEEEVRSAIDRGANPCDDFYQYACGRWVGRTLLPDGEAYWTRGAGVAADRARGRMREVLERAATDGASDEAALGRFYRTCMDDEGALSSLKKQLDAIAGSKRHSDFMRAAGAVTRMGATPLMRVSVGPDGGTPNTVALHVHQGGLALPDLRTYVSGDDQHRALLDAYRAHVEKMFALVGMDGQQAADAALAVVHFESALAGYQSAPTDPASGYETLTTKELRKRVPFLPWTAFLEGLGRPDIDRIVVESARHLGGIGLLLSRTPPARRYAYLRWQLILRSAEHVPELADAHFEFFGKRLGHMQAPAERWKRCIRATEAAMPMRMGRAYVARFFVPERRDEALEIIAGIEGELAAKGPGREQTQARLAALRKLVGHPGTWPSPAAFSPGASDHLSNLFEASHAQTDVRLSRVGKPFAPDEWTRSPFAFAAEYVPNADRITLPAALLQPPFVGPDRPAVASFAALGHVVGHELTHMARSPALDEHATCLRKTYDAEQLGAGVSVDGDLTYGEALADHGGLELAYGAYRGWARAHGRDETPHVPGLTNDQLFFVAFAQTRCAATTAEHVHHLATAGPFAPPPVSVNLPAAALPAFAEAFECPPGAAMNPQPKCTVW